MLHMNISSALWTETFDEWDAPRDAFRTPRLLYIFPMSWSVYCILTAVTMVMPIFCDSVTAVFLTTGGTMKPPPPGMQSVRRATPLL